MTDFQYKRAIIRKISQNYPNCVSNHPQHSNVSVTKAKKQHKAYHEVLKSFVKEIIVLPSLDYFPDACFVEDTAVVHKSKALITRFGALSRRGEEESIEVILSDYLKVERASHPACIEGGDVVHISERERLICGITQRTNMAGVIQMRSSFDINVQTIVNSSIVHLKSYISYLGRNTILTTDDYTNSPPLAELEVLNVPKEEIYAANALAFKDTIILPEGFPFTKKIVKNADYDVICIEMSEFQKCEGALTCLSILF